MPLSRLVHKNQRIECLSPNSPASPHTKFGVNLTGRAKQAWLREDAYGCAYVPSSRELLALHETTDDLYRSYACAGSDAVGDASGDSVAMRFAEAQAHRAASRARRYVTATRLAAAGDDNFPLERHVASFFDEYSDALGKATFLVLITRPPDRVLRALVADDLLSLPLLERDQPVASVVHRHGAASPAGPAPPPLRSPRELRTSAVDAAERLLRRAGFDSHRPVAFLAGDSPHARLVALPLEHDVELAPTSGSYFRWASLDDIAGTTIYEPVATAMGL